MPCSFAFRKKSRKLNFLRVLASLAYYRTVPFNFVLTVIEICDARFHLAIPSLRSLQLRLAAPQAVKRRLFYQKTAIAVFFHLWRVAEKLCLIHENAIGVFFFTAGFSLFAKSRLSARCSLCSQQYGYICNNRVFQGICFTCFKYFY